MIKEIEDKRTEDLLTTNNYRLWLQEIDILISGKGLEDYLYEQKMELIEEDMIPFQSRKLYRKVKGRDGLRYTFSVTENMIKEDKKS